MTTLAPDSAVEEGSEAPRTGSDRVTLSSLALRLSRLAVEHHFDAFVDVPWDDPAMAMHPEDPRWILPADEPLGRTEWYRAQPRETQARIGLHRVAMNMRTGWEFENILQRGLLTVAYRLPNQTPEFRFLHHEVIEESQHTLMFQEFVDRSGLLVTGLPRLLKATAERIVLPLARLFPPLFFLFVLGGEDPIDAVQRHRLREGIAHPLLERIVRIHVTEEARHLSFARQYLKAETPSLGILRRIMLSLAAPLLLGQMAHQMLIPSRRFAKQAGVPSAVRREVARSNEARVEVSASVAKVRRLCSEMGLMNRVPRLLWRLCGVAELSAP